MLKKIKGMILRLLRTIKVSKCDKCFKDLSKSSDIYEYHENEKLVTTLCDDCNKTYELDISKI